MYGPTRASLIVVASLLFSASSAIAQTAAADPSGHWEGQIQIPDHVLTMSLDLTKSPTGAWIGSMSIVGTTAMDIPLDTIAVADAVRFIAGLPGRTSFDGRLSADAGGLSGTVSNDEGGVPFQLTRHGEAHVSVPPPSSPLSPAFEGTWEGALESGGQARRVRVKLSKTADGTATGTLISVDKGNLEIPVTTVTLHDTQLQLDARSISGTYRGTLGPDGTIAGEWTEPALHVSLTLTRAASALKR